MTQQAILQRNTQWAGEQHLFLSSMRAMMAYIEGFVFAVTPLMGLLVCVGLFGVRLAFKYLMLLLWIQLWMPVLAINNLYITLVSQGAMAALSAPITSFTGIMESGPILEYWLGVGGLMAASTPALVLMLLYGSAITATHLAGRMQSGDFVNEKIPAPDIMMPGSAINQQAGWNIGPQQGATKGQIDQVVPALSASSHLSNMVQSKDAARQTAGLAFSQATSKAFHERYGDKVDAMEFERFSKSLSSGSSETSQFRDNLGRDIQNRFGLSASVSREMATGKVLELGGRGQLTSFQIQQGHKSGSHATDQAGVYIGYNRSIKGMNKESHNDSVDKALNYLSDENLSKGWNAQLQKAMKSDAGSSQQHSWTKELGVSNDQNFQKVASESLTRDQSYEQANQLQQQIGQALNAGPAVWAHKIAESSQAMDALKSKPYDSEFHQNAQKSFNQIKGQFASNDESLAAALVSSYLQSGSDDDLNRLNKALSYAGLTIPAGKVSSTLQANQKIMTEADSKIPARGIDSSIAKQLQSPPQLSSSVVNPQLRHSNQESFINQIARDYDSKKSGISDQFHHSSQYKSHVTELLKNSAFGRQASSTGKGIKMLPQEAFGHAKEFGLTDNQAMIFSSMVADRHPHYDRSTNASDRMGRLGQAIAEVSRGWGDSHSAVLGWHAFNHLSHAADNPQHTDASLKLIGEMNRLHQPELQQYEESITKWLNGQSLYPMEGNYLDVSMPPEHIGVNTKTELEHREKENNDNLFGNREQGRFVENNSRAVRLKRDIEHWIEGQVKPD